MKLITTFLVCIVLIFLNCFYYLPEYIHIDEYSCNKFKDDYVREIKNKNGDGYFKLFYSFGIMDSMLSYYKNGNINSITRFKDGDLHEKTEEYYLNGAMRATVEFDHNIEMFKSREQYDSVGNKLFEWVEDGETQIYKSKYSSGEKDLEIHFRDNKLHGYFTRWRRDSSLIEKLFYEDGKLRMERSNVYDARGKSVTEKVKMLMYSVIPDLRGIYGSYSRKYTKLGKEVRFLVIEGKDQDNTQIYLLYTDSNCSEMISNLEVALKKHENLDIALSDDEFQTFVLPFVFRGF